MRLEITERGPKEFYDEIMYIAANFKKFRTKPNKKTHSQTVVYTGYCVMSLLVVLVFLLEYFKEHNGMFLLLSGMMLVCFLLFIVMIASMKKRIGLMMNEPGAKIVDIDEKGVRYESERQTLFVKWDEIINVIINKNSIVFMPRTDMQLMVSVYTRYKDQVLQAIEAAGRMDLVCDNTSKN